jgi:hypothetical protein
VVLVPKSAGSSKTGQAQSRMSQGVINRTLVKGLWKGQPKRVTVP